MTFKIAENRFETESLESEQKHLLSQHTAVCFI
jgi:hypothetical protein